MHLSTLDFQSAKLTVVLWQSSLPSLCEALCKTQVMILPKASLEEPWTNSLHGVHLHRATGGYGHWLSLPETQRSKLLMRKALQDEHVWHWHCPLPGYKSPLPRPAANPSMNPNPLRVLLAKLLMMDKFSECNNIYRKKPQKTWNFLAQGPGNGQGLNCTQQDGIGRLVNVLSDPHYLSLMRLSQGVEILSSEVLAQGLIMHFMEETPLLLPTPSWPTSVQETSGCLQKWHTAVKGGFIAS